MDLELLNLQKRFASLRRQVAAVDRIDLNVDDGEFFVLLGPSGCGKSTLLNLVAGLEKPTAGEIRFGGRTVAAPAQGIFLSPRERNVAMVFQGYALYPHLSVRENIAFPLRIARRPQGEIAAAVERVASSLDISGGLLEEKPARLSGGQRQRVAIARALVRDPVLFLLDEPLSNLDAQLRAATRSHLKSLQRQTGITALYVTHDQHEAMTLGDRVAVLRKGSVEQVGPPLDLYHRPANPFVAGFIGSPPMNLHRLPLEEKEGRWWAMLAEARLPVPDEALPGLRPARGGSCMVVGIRPEHLRPVSGEMAPETRPWFGARVKAVEALGREFLVHLEREGRLWLALTAEGSFREGDTVRLELEPERVHFFAPEEA